MARVFRRVAPLAFVAVASCWIAFSNTATGDYPFDGALAVEALARGDVSAYLSTHVMMGPFATLVQAPFAALGGGEGLTAYQWACLPCLFAVGLLGLYLGGIARRRGVPAPASWAIAALCLLNPLTFAAVEFGHPEELLTAALAVAAVATAAQGQRGRAALLLGLAIASKQWAVLAALPVLMALPGGRVRAALGAGAVVAVLMLPGFLASPSAFFETQHSAASTGGVIDPWSVWYPLAGVSVEENTIGGTRYVAEVHRAPDLVGSLSHPLIVLLFVAVPLALAWRRGGMGISGADAMALLALLSLLRCALDPVGNLYYHEPLLLALIGWDAFDSRRLPLRSLAAAALLLLFDFWSRDLDEVVLFNLTYVAVASAAAAAIALSLFRPQEAGRTAGRSLDVRPSPVA